MQNKKAVKACMYVSLFTLIILQQHNMQAKIESEIDNQIKIENMLTLNRQPWRPVQEAIHDTVVQIFSQVAEIDLLEPYKTPAQFGARGSGFFINDQGYLVTNAHVVDQAIAIWVCIPALGKHFVTAHIIGICPERDLALLCVDNEDLEIIRQELGGISFLSLGDSDLVRRADEVLALGYPLGQESLKSTTGVISGREQHFIQISAPINPGSSGGPLLNINGEVIGINSGGFQEAQSVGYIIPINDLKLILPDLYKTTLLRKPFLGILSSHGTESLTSFLGNPKPGGCYVVEVVKDSPIYKAGVQKGDMIYEINGNRLDIYGDMNVEWSEDKVSIVDYISRLGLGEDVHLVVYRNAERMELTVKFDQADVLPIHKIYPGYEDIDYEIFGGMVVMPLTINHIKLLADRAPGLSDYARLNNQAEPVLLITHVFHNSYVSRTRTITAGITINKVNGVAVKTLDEFREAIKRSVQNDYFVMNVADNITRASDDILVVLPFRKILEEGLTLSRDYRYPLSETVKELLTMVK